MEGEQRRSLMEEARTGGFGYVRDLAAAEAAVLRGQFNLAKVLRALAHAQRTQALEAARRLGDGEPTAALRTALAELARFPPESDGERQGETADDLAVGLTRLRAARRTAQEVAERALASVEVYRDVREDDVGQVVWGCYGCGALMDGALPDYCPVCGALAAEFERFAPFYIATPEHLGQLAPPDLLAILTAIPGQVAEALAGTAEAALQQRPSPNDWCVKEIVGHMLETDLLFQRAVRTILANSGLPEVDASVPPWKLQEGKGYERLATPLLLQRLQATRESGLRLLRDLPPAAWIRRGAMRGVTPSLIDLGTWLANHDRGHLAQIRELCAT